MKPEEVSKNLRAVAEEHKKDFISTFGIRISDMATDAADAIDLLLETAHWTFWDGWTGNHDKRIDDAKCSKCGYKHPTVYGSLDQLSNYCPNCGSKMKVKGV